MVEEKTTREELKLMAKALREMQLMLEPIRDKVLDEKARLTGYAQCAEQMISIIVAKMADYEKRSEPLPVEPESKIEDAVEKTDKPERKKKVAKQEIT